jgi:hypothetical protein
MTEEELRHALQRVAHERHWCKDGGFWSAIAHPDTASEDTDLDNLIDDLAADMEWMNAKE